MDKLEAVKKSEKYLNLIAGTIRIQRAYLFGPHASGNAYYDSDIDIALYIDSINDDYLLTLKKLYRLRRSIDVRIKPYLFISGYDPSGFSDDIEKFGHKLL